ncbi:FFLEELY motif protein [Roseateles sp. DB2]|uniref:FFLEELY motif protein n=1 Tax=Roseateles sp. DB2 TaxID=3453717 RepID=UPI003EECE324
MVEQERQRRLAEPSLHACVQAVKQFQQQRFARTYADLLASPRYAAAARFFLEELYGPGDFSGRDAQFARVVPALVRLFPEQVVQTVLHLAELHALSEQLDGEMADVLGASPLSSLRYVQAWQTVGKPERRQQQIDLTLAVGASLDHLTRKPLLRQALRMMRGPAAAAGLAELQRFLEQGFDTFKAMRGASDFLGTVRQREQDLAAALFAAAVPPGTDCLPSDGRLGQLP